MDKNTDLKKRTPIVVILGHVDHGKTTLLDFIRSTRVAQKEAGGITQSIGASEVITPAGDKITFIDTPGHAAFSNMRSRGAKTADIAILVVAANDGVKPQTKEALEYILSAKIPFIVAATKIDLPQVSIDTVRTQLQKEGVLFEGKGGDVPLIGVSGKTGQGVKELFEMISLVSELNEVKGDINAGLDAKVIETSKEKSGLTVSVVVKSGKLVVGDELVSENGEAKVRALFNTFKAQVKSAGPGEAVQILGFNNPPPIGSSIWSKTDNKVLPVEAKKAEAVLATDEGKLSLLIKARNAGSLEAVLMNLPKEVFVIASSVGDITESDVFLAKSGKASIFAFESKAPTAVSRLAETEGVEIETFDIIYRLFEKVTEILKKGEIEILGTAQVIASFPFEEKRVAGCKIIQGKIKKHDTLILKRADTVIGEIKVLSIRKGKNEVAEVKQGEECGIFFAPQLDFKLSDMLISQRK